MAPDDTTPTAPEGDVDSALAPVASDAPAPRKRAPRKTVRKATADVLPGAQPELGAPEGSVAPPRAPRKRAPRKATAAAQPAPVELPIEPMRDEQTVREPTVEEPTAEEATPEELTVEEPAAEELTVEEPTLEEATAEEATAAASLPTFTVLFRPPDPTAAGTTPTRRRRAVRPALEVTGAEVTSPEVTGPEVTGPVQQTSTVEASPEEGPLAGADGSRPDEADADEGAEGELPGRRARRRRGGKGRRARSAAVEQESESYAGAPSPEQEPAPAPDEADAPGPLTSADGQPDGEPSDEPDEEGGTSRRRRRRRRAGVGDGGPGEEPGGRVREGRPQRDEPTAVRGSTRLEAKKQRRREGREAGRRRTVITEAEFLARRESVDRVMVVRNKDGRTQMGVLEDGVLVEHYIDQATTVSMAGSIYLGRVQNVLPSMEAAFVDIGKGRNAVLYAGEVNWDAAGLEVGQSKRIENALEPGQTVLVQVTKDPIGHKGARLTSQISLPGRYLVYVPNSSMTGISRKLPDTERARLKKILREVVPDDAGVIVRTAAEGASEEELRADVERLTRTWEDIRARADAASSPKAARSKGRKKTGSSAGPSAGGTAPLLLHGEPDLTVRVIRDVFNEDFKQLLVSGEQAWEEIHPYITSVAPDLADRVSRWTGPVDLFTQYRVDEQLAKAMDRKVWLPSGGSLVIDRTEAMTVIDVNTGKFIGAGGNLEETVTKNNIEAAEEIVRQLRLRDIGGIIVIDFIDMVLESNRELVVRRLLECLGRDRTKHQVAEVTSLGLVQMTRKRVGAGLIEVFSHTCEQCNGRGFLISAEPLGRGVEGEAQQAPSRGRRERRDGEAAGPASAPVTEHPRPSTGPTAAQIAAAAHAAALKRGTAGESVELQRDGGQDEAEPGEARRGPEEEGHEPPPTVDSQPVQPVQVVQVVEQAAPGRPRRRRGRVVAPAGPPRGGSGAPAERPDDTPSRSEPDHAGAPSGIPPVPVTD